MSLQGSSSNTLKRAFDRTLRHLGQSRAWSLGLLSFFILVTAILSFLTDAIRLDSFNPLWFVVSPLGWVPTFIIGLIYKKLVLDKDPNKSRPIVSFVVAGLAGSARNLSVGYLAGIFQLDLEGVWAFRAFGGFVVGAGIYMVWAIGTGARNEYLASMHMLTTAQKHLARVREQIPQHLNEVNTLIEERTRAAVLPQFNLIREEVGQASSIPAAIERLRQTLAENIRPVMSQLAHDRPAPIEVEEFQVELDAPSRLPERYKLRDKISVGWSMFIVWMGVSLWFILLSSDRSLINSLLVTSSFGITLAALKLLIPKSMSFSKYIGIALTSAISMIASGVAAVTLATIGLPENEQLMVIGFIVFTGLAGPVFLVQANSRVDQRIENEARVRQYLEDIAKENARFAQKVWVFRKRWLLILHGTVQSALTAAIVRLQSGEVGEGVARQLALQDIQRAEAAVTTQLSAAQNFEKELSELVRVWLGICEVSSAVSERARRVLYKQTDVAFCANEILKEAISNAVRHGSATEARVTIDRELDDLLTIKVWNNGSAPERKDRIGIGSEMMNEVCLRWNLSGNRGDVTLLAELPVSLTN